MRRPVRTAWIFAVVGLAGGFFSALFGVGGGVVIVPLLIVLAAFDPKEATGTSLAAIGLTATSGALAFGLLGEVHWTEAAVVGLPAMAGTVFGTWFQQRIASPTLKILLAILLAAIAVELLVG